MRLLTLLEDTQMAASYQVKKYQTDAGTIGRIRISDQSLSFAANVEPAGAIDDENIFAFASNPGSRKKKQLNARGLRLQRFTGTGAARKRFTTFLPILTQSVLDAQTIGDEIVLGSVSYTIADKVAEA